MSEFTDESIQLDFTPFLNVNQAVFQGPLQLCLELIRKHKLDIHSISLAAICEPYLEYLQQMEDFDLEVAVEFLDMASTLILIKAKRLLPRTEELDLSEMDLNPEETLRRKLILYQQFQTLANQLLERDRIGQDFFTRPSECPLEEQVTTVDLEWDLTIYQLLRSYKYSIQRQTFIKPHQVRHDEKSIEEKVLELLHLLKPDERACFQDLLRDEVFKSEVVLGFMGILELAKIRALQIQQVQEFGPIHLLPSKNIQDWIQIFADRANALGLLKD